MGNTRLSKAHAGAKAAGLSDKRLNPYTGLVVAGKGTRIPKGKRKSKPAQAVAANSSLSLVVWDKETGKRTTLEALVDSGLMSKAAYKRLLEHMHHAGVAGTSSARDAAYSQTNSEFSITLQPLATTAENSNG